MKRSSTHIFQNHDLEFEYSLHRKTGQRHRYIRVKDQKVIVTAPYTASLRSIQNFIEEKSEWIIKHLSSQQSLYDLTARDAYIFVKGIKHQITIKKSTLDRVGISNGYATFYLSSAPSHLSMLELLQKYYKEHAPKDILPKVKIWSETMNLEPAKVSFRRAKTRWGSCSSRNTISLNTYLMMLPDHLQDYIIVHELSHIKHKNHGPKFWGHVERFIPDWKNMRGELRKFEAFLQ